MLKFLRKKPKERQPPQLLDLHGSPIYEGLTVLCHRYELGKSNVILEDLHFYYESIHSGQRVSYTKMIDAITGNQKVEVAG